MRLTTIICLGAMACAVAVAEPAAAQIQPAGTGEPAYTNSVQNTQWFEWPASSGIDAYRGRFDYYDNNTLKSSPVVGLPNGGSTSANWSGVTTLQHGGQYGICAQGEYSFPNDSLFYPDGPNSCSMGSMLGRRTYTTIDRAKPSAAVHLAADASYVRDPKIPVRVDFSDDLAGPFPANFLCFQVGGGPAGVCDSGAGYVYGYNAACSVPATGGKSTTFSCTADYGNVPDGSVWACVIAADASIPDNPYGPDQRASAEKANLSGANCDGVVLDRTPPAVSIGAASTAVHVGDLVSFQSSATDATSGLAGAGQWSFGDNTGGASGDAVTHTYTQPGTYEVALTVTDAAGNAAVAKRVVSVTAVAGGGGGTTTPPPGGGGGGTTTPPGGGTTTPPGGGTTTPPASPSLTLSAPRKAKAGVKRIALKLTAHGVGRVQLSLAQGKRVLARAGVRLGAAGTTTYRLKLPKHAKAGRYTLRATFTPASGRAVTASRKLILTGKAAARRASAGSVTRSELGRGPRSLPDGRFHGDRPARTFEVPEA